VLPHLGKHLQITESHRRKILPSDWQAHWPVEAALTQSMLKPNIENASIEDNDIGPSL